MKPEQNSIATFLLQWYTTCILMVSSVGWLLGRPLFSHPLTRGNHTHWVVEEKVTKEKKKKKATTYIRWLYFLEKVSIYVVKLVVRYLYSERQGRWRWNKIALFVRVYRSMNCFCSGWLSFTPWLCMYGSYYNWCDLWTWSGVLRSPSIDIAFCIVAFRFSFQTTQCFNNNGGTVPTSPYNSPNHHH
jgi:hypothetical protein